MIVAIIDQSAPSGKVPVTQFQMAADEAAAVAQYVGAFNPPKNPADWLGFNTGWTQPVHPTPGNIWAYDFDAPGLVQIVDPGDRFRALSMTQVIGDAKADGSSSTPSSWEDMGLLSADLDEFYDSDMSDALIKVWGQHKTAKVDPGDPLLRFTMGSTALSDELVLPDTGGSWSNFALNTHGYVLEEGRKLYKVQTKLAGASNTIELRAVSIAVLQRQEH
jgi:hypothetical protein